MDLSPPPPALWVLHCGVRSLVPSCRDPVAIRLRSERDPSQFYAILLSQHTIFSRDPARPLTPSIILIARAVGDAVDSLEFYLHHASGIVFQKASQGNAT